MNVTATHKEITMHENDHDDVQHETFTAMVCEQAELFGATPGPDEFDNRPVWDKGEATAAVLRAFGILAEAAPDGTQLAEERASLLWGFVNTLDAQTQRLDRAADRLIPGIRELQREQDGSEIRSRELELATDRANNLTERRDAFEQLRDTAAEAYRSETGEVWRPRRGSHVSQTGKLTSAVIEARDFQRAKKDRENTAHLPQGTPRRRRGRKGVDRRGKNHRASRQGQGQVRRRRPRPRRRPRRGEDSGGMGRTKRRPPDRLQARLGRTRQGGSLPAQRRALKPASQGRGRVPGFWHHGQPRRQGPKPRHSRPENRRLT